MTRSGGHHGAIIPAVMELGMAWAWLELGMGFSVGAGYILAGDTVGGMDGFIHVRTTPLPGHSHLMLPIAARRQELIATVRQGVLAVETARRQPGSLGTRPTYRNGANSVNRGNAVSSTTRPVIVCLSVSPMALHRALRP